MGEGRRGGRVRGGRDVRWGKEGRETDGSAVKERRETGLDIWLMSQMSCYPLAEGAQFVQNYT